MSTAPSVIAGMMRIAEKTDAEIRALYDTARGRGVTYFDHADLYGVGAPGGGYHRCESRFAGALNLSASARDEIVLQSKVGIVTDGPYYDSSYEHIIATVEESLTALRTDRLDVLLLHRPDALVEPDEVARAFDELEATGKVRAFGVSNHTPRQIDLLRTAVRQPLVVNQLQLSITHAPVITQGLTANIVGEPGAVDVDGGGVLDYCRLNGITVQAWSPFQKGTERGVFLGDPGYAELNAVLGEIGDAHGVAPAAVATAWILRHPARMQVVLGSTDPSRFAEASGGADVELSRREWYRLLRAAGHRLP